MQPSSKARRGLVWFGAGGLVLLVLGVAVFTQTRLDRELSALPEAERRALYDRTLETLRTSCSQPPGPEVAAFCREQADFIQRLPECDSPCRELAARFASPPSR